MNVGMDVKSTEMMVERCELKLVGFWKFNNRQKIINKNITNQSPNTYATCSACRSSPANKRTSRSCTGRARCSVRRTAADRTGRPSSRHDSDNGPIRKRRAVHSPNCTRLWNRIRVQCGLCVLEVVGRQAGIEFNQEQLTATLRQ